jgi:hypothetical protein
MLTFQENLDELLPRVGFIVTNIEKKVRKAKSVLDFYNGRGTAEGWIKEGKYALNCHAQNRKELQ